MKPGVKLFILFLILLMGNKIISQNDVITTIKGEKINCVISKEDSIKVYFKIGGNLSSVEASILRSEIESIQYAKKQQVPTLTVNPDQVVHDDYVAPTSSTIPTASIIPAKPKLNNLSLFIGMSNPIGKFKSEQLDTNEIGPAKNGQVIGIGFTHLIKPNFGITLNGFFANNELNAAPITSKYNSYTDSVWNASKAYWRSYGVNFGVIYHKELIKDLSFNAKLNAGYMSLIYPDVKLSVSSSNFLQFQSVTSDAVSFGGGVGFGYKILEGLNVNLEMNYLQALVKYNEILVQGEEPATPFNKKISLTKRDIKQHYQTVFFNLGLSYWF